jgi:uncharacterized protein YqhQ
MTNTLSYCILLAVALLVCVMAAYSPGPLSDENSFLRGFVSHELLSVLGVIVTITLASSAQLHLTLNQIEERHQTEHAFLATRSGIRGAAFALIILFVLAVVLVVAKPLLASADWSQTLFNGAALLILVWNILILVSLTEAVFGLKPVMR